MKKISKYNQALKTIVRVIIYLRVSTEDQARREDNSLDTQEIFCKRLIALNEKRNWRLVKVITDPGYSAKDLKRPGIYELTEAMESGQVDVIVVYKLDRLTRSMRDLYKLWDIMEPNGVDFASATESFDSSTPDGRAALNQRMTFAQWEREMTAQRLQDKFAEDARKGKWHPCMAPFGYDPDSRNKTLSVNDQEAKILKIMFKMAAAGKGLKVIADHVNALGSKSRKRVFNKGRDNERAVGGRKWTVKTVRSHLENPKYKAVTRDRSGNEYPAIWKAIVTDKLWEKANHVLEKRRQQSERPKASVNKHELVLKGFIKCGHCGSAMSPRGGGRKLPDGTQRAYYCCCQNVIDFGQASKCQLRNLPGKDFDQFLIRLIGAYAQHPKLIKATLKAALEEKKKSLRLLRSQQRELNKQLKQIDTEIKNLLKLARQGKGSFSKELYDDADVLADQKRTIEARRDQLKAQIQYKEQVVADEETVSKALGNFSKAIYALPFSDREELIGLLIKSLKVTRIDPKTDELPCELNTLDSIKPVKWFRIDVEFYIQSIFGGQPASGSEANVDSLADREKSIRTRMNSTFIVGVVGQNWKAGAFLKHPFQLEKQAHLNTRKMPKFRIRRTRHLLETATEWKAILEDHPDLGARDIAEQVGLSPRRVRHVLNLTNLHPEIQEFILKLTPKKSCQLLSERTLRPIVQLAIEGQWTRFETVLKKRNLA
ncbi:MAG: hypothetical protein CML13_02470 [Puniceicoccaceae bacterium]|nr:hypothetical protein [Puniceicoccaceae bacterium]